MHVIKRGEFLKNLLLNSRISRVLVQLAFLQNQKKYIYHDNY